MLSPAQIEQYREDGYLMVAGYFPQVDMDRLLAVARADQALADNASAHPDADGKVSRLSLRSELPESAYSAYVRHRDIVEPMEQLLGEEVFHADGLGDGGHGNASGQFVGPCIVLEIPGGGGGPAEGDCLLELGGLVGGGHLLLLHAK